MALYKYPQILSFSAHPAFDETRAPGTLAPDSGIYRCIGCGHEAVSTAGHRLPPQASHVHRPDQGHISWQLIVGTAT
jgi:hypothetical protein